MKTKYIVQCYFPTLNETVNYYIPTLEPVKSYGYVIAIFKIKTIKNERKNKTKD